MLTLAKITRRTAGGYASYLEGKAKAPELGDYYLKDGERVEAQGRWAQGAQHFGLSSEQVVTGEQLRTLMDVRRADTGSELRSIGGSGEAVAAIDATFSAPKSVSAVWALAGPRLRSQIEGAHETAIDQALTYATEQVRMLRRRVTENTVIYEKASGLVATSWRHATARAVAGRAPDPQLHSHVLLHAAVRRDGRLVAIDSRSWLTHQREVGAAYRTELARELNQLGFQIQRGTGRGGRYFEIKGVPQALLDRWSSRHQQVQEAIRQRLNRDRDQLTAIVEQGGTHASEALAQLEALKASGQLSPRQERSMGAITRAAKTNATVEDLDREWRHTALHHQLTGEHIEGLRHQPEPALQPASPSQVLDALTEFDATFAAREARAVALEQSAGTPIRTALEQLQELRASREILVLADKTGTTRWHRASEQATVQRFKTLAESTVPVIPDELVTYAETQIDRRLAASGGQLSDEQRAALRLACGDRQVVMIEGQAGTGKSTLLQAVALAHHADGRDLIVTSTAALAAQRLAADITETGVRATPYSTVALQHAIDRGRLELGPETTVIHDEAALASTREQHDLFQEIEETGARLIIVGDPAQSKPVGAGGLWPHLQHTAQQHELRVELTQNLRALDPADRRDQQLFRHGSFEHALQGYVTRDRVHTAEDSWEAEHHALLAAHRDRQAGLRTIVIAQTSNEHLDELNAHAQALRHQDSELGRTGVPVPGRPYRLHPGDHIQIRHSTPHPNGHLRNGTTATVAAIEQDGSLTITLADHTQRTLDREQIERADLRLAYVQHPFPAQGHTADTGHVIIGGNGTREGMYVALTRARLQTHIYAADPQDVTAGGDRLARLAGLVSHSEPEVPSISTALAHEATVTGDNEAEAGNALTGSNTRDTIERLPVPPATRNAPHEADWDRPDNCVGMDLPWEKWSSVSEVRGRRDPVSCLASTRRKSVAKSLSSPVPGRASSS